jgi:hypothetical protein
MSAAAVTAAFNIHLAVAEAIRALGEVPSGHLYARVCDKLTLDQYQRIIATLVESGRVTNSGHLLRWVDQPALPEPARLTWKRGAFTVATAYGPKECAGWVEASGVWAVQQTVPGNSQSSWTVTHRPTGLAACYLRGPGYAKRAAALFAGLPMDWTSTDAKALGSNPHAQALSKALRTTKGFA